MNDISCNVANILAFKQQNIERKTKNHKYKGKIVK